MLAGVALGVARHLGVRLPDVALLSAWGAAVEVSVPADLASPRLVGRADQVLLDRGTRRGGGVFHTPPTLASHVVGWGLPRSLGPRTRVCDPAVGGGAFLLAAGDALVAGGADAAEVVRHDLVGVDLDPVAVAVTEVALCLWCGGAAVPAVETADALLREAGAWGDPFDLVATNPPFLGQLTRRTARSRSVATALRDRYGAAAGGYVDTASVFLLLGCDLVAPGGGVAMVLPRSFLAAGHATGVRRAVLAGATLERLWLPDDGAFDASVSVCVPVLRRDGDRRVRLARATGTPPVELAPTELDVDALAAAPSWAHLVAGPGAPPPVDAEVAGVLGDGCRVAADFRDEYYGLAPFVLDDVDGERGDEAFPPLVTSGLIDPARCLWGQRPVRYLRRRWDAPRVDLHRLRAESGLGRWATERLVPKVVVATQTRVLEAAVDPHGRWLPSTPVISVVPPPGRLWHAAAVLLSPVASAWAVLTYGGAARSAGAVKLSAGQVRAIPLPVDEAAWSVAAGHVRRASEAVDAGERRRSLHEAAAASTAAYGIEAGDELVAWWAARLPERP
jgi:hypothetical protein